MTNKFSSKRHDFSAVPGALVLILGVTLTSIGANASAQQQLNSQRAAEVVSPVSSLAELEKAFWICDHAATKHGVDGGTAIMCGAITEELKMKKFNGDFDSMLVWWRQSKAAKHQALATAGAVPAGL